MQSNAFLIQALHEWEKHQTILQNYPSIKHPLFGNHYIIISNVAVTNSTARTIVFITYIFINVGLKKYQSAINGIFAP
ncbi:hypothetical protein A8L34_07350 [Bacillus sp. FJAT-27264]|nr:hypothetical protein A8L34_07350 [Bacillus sp. FJAT-27264]